MATVIEVLVPTEDFALKETLAALPDVDLEIERIVAGNPKQITPYVWARADDFDALEAAFEADPTVECVTKLSESTEERAYQMGWTGPIELIVGLLTDYQGTITHATGSNTGWQVRALFPDRKSLSQACDVAQELGLQYDVQALYEPKGSRPHHTGLTDKQRDTLVAAFDAGCFTVPREVTLAEFAEEKTSPIRQYQNGSDGRQAISSSRRSSLTAMRRMSDMEDSRMETCSSTRSAVPTASPRDGPSASLRPSLISNLHLSSRTKTVR